MVERVAARPDDQMSLIGRLGVQANGLGLHDGDRRCGPGRPRLDVAEKLLQALDQPVADPPADADDHPLGPVPGVDVGEERLASRSPHGLLAPDDVPAERLVSEEERSYTLPM